MAEDTEECDGIDLKGISCADLGFLSGNLNCNQCSYDKSGCIECTEQNLSLCTSGQICQNGHCVTQDQTVSCGNNIAEDGEECDGSDFREKTCSDFEEFVDGNLTCSQCSFDKSECLECTEQDLSLCADGQICPNGRCVDPDHVVTCGDELAENPEECDGSDLRWKTCANFDGFVDGTLKCNACSYDTSECVECTNDSHCANRDDGKTHCESNACTKPADTPQPPPSSDKIVISQAYPGGGNSKAILNTKYIELFNRSDKDVDISNWSIQYGSSNKDTIASTCVLPSNAIIAKGGYYLIAFQKGDNGDDLITPDHTCGTFAPAAANGKLFLVSNSEKLPSSQPESGYVDALGYGNANWAEGNNPAPALSSKLAAFRKDGGCIDTDDNGNDFEKDAPEPRNSKSPLHLCNGTQPPEKSCGNGKLDDDEFCDGSLFLGNETACKYWDSLFESGEVTCNQCEIDFSGCSLWAESVCGNGILDDDEDCDGTKFYKGYDTCYFWDPSYSNGKVTCNHCEIDYSKCSNCGNGKLEADEDCDGNKFVGNKTSCQSWDSKYSSGNVSCYHCEIDYSNCKTPPTCGNGKLDSGEQCDGSVFLGDKTTCESWDTTYNSGNVTCNQCQVDYSNCQKKPVCGNKKLENGEDCDGNLFKDDKTSCAEWNASKYNRGDVSCQECQINYSKCSYMGPTTCLTGQEWSEKYNTCVYPIRSESDWNTYVSKWNSECSAAYPNGADKTAFLLKNDISLNNPLQWGGDGCAFNANFYGENHTISLTVDKKGRRLFGYINQANLQDIKVKLSATQYAESLISKKVSRSSVSNMTITGSWHYTGDESGYITFYYADSATFNYITIDLNARFEPSKAGVYTSPLMYKSNSSRYTDIKLKGNYIVKSIYHNDYSGFICESEDDSFNKCEIEMELSVQNMDPSNTEQWTSLLARELKGSLINRVNIKKLDVHHSEGIDVTLVWEAKWSTYSPRLYNVEDNTRLLQLNSDTEFSHGGFFRSAGELYVYNSVFNSNFNYYTIAGFYNSVINDVFSKMDSMPYKAGYAHSGATIKNIYIKENIENGEVTPYLLNSNAKDLINSGYLPWKQDSDGVFHLRFDATDSELL